jgi:adenylate cyclase
LPATPSLTPWGPVRRLGYGAALGLLVASGLWLLRGTTLLDTLELRLVDVRTRAFVGRRAADPRIVLCEVLEEDHERLTRSSVAPGEDWPWPLWMHERLFRALAAAPVRATVVDLLFLDRGRSLEDLTLKPGEEDEPWVAVDTGEAAEAPALAAAMKAAGAVVLGVELQPRPTSDEQPARVTKAVAALLGDPAFAPQGGLLLDHAALPVSGLIPGATLLGFTNVGTDADGVLRRAVAVGAWDGRPLPSLPLAGAWLATDGARSVTPDEVRLGAAVQRLDERGGFTVNFRGEPGKAFRTTRPADLVQIGVWLADEGKARADLPPEAVSLLDDLKGAIVVYGVNLAGADDVVSSPLSGRHHGPEYQATVLDNLLHGDGRVSAPRRTNLLLLLGLCGAAGELGTLLKGRGLPHLPALALLAGLVLLAWAEFAAGLVLDVVTPALGLLLTWGGAGVLRLVTEGRRNKWLEGTFGRYVAPEVIEALKKNPELLALGGRRRDLTVLFSDVAGFTKISEALGAEQVVRLLNRYLTTQSEQVMRTGGVIDKFIGDAVMAFWGDPLDTPDQALRAVRAALACQAALPTLAPIVDELGLTDFHMRIGINSGPALVGNMGSEARFDYTCMGDTVNLASRLEGANKAFGTRLIVGAPTYLMVRDQVVAKRLGDLVVVGRAAPVRVYEVLSLVEDAPPALVAHAEAFRTGHEALRRGDLGGARQALEEALRLRPGDGPTEWLLGLLAKMEAGDASIPWDGLVSLKEK